MSKTDDIATDTIQKWYGTESIGPKENDELSYLIYACLTPLGNEQKITDNNINLVKCAIFAAFQMGRRHPYTGPNWIVQNDEPKIT